MVGRVGERLTPLRHNRDFVVFQTGQLLSAIETNGVDRVPVAHARRDELVAAVCGTLSRSTRNVPAPADLVTP
jgi:hypothetical protein